MTSMTKPEALLTTPADNAECPKCMADFLADFLDPVRADLAGPYPTCSRFSSGEFAHCDLCGSTDLVDTRSPWEVLREAEANVAQAIRDGLATEIVWGRRDVADRVKDLAAQVPADHCSDCRRFARRQVTA